MKRKVISSNLKKIRSSLKFEPVSVENRTLKSELTNIRVTLLMKSFRK